MKVKKSSKVIKAKTIAARLKDVEVAHMRLSLSVELERSSRADSDRAVIAAIVECLKNDKAEAPEIWKHLASRIERVRERGDAYIERLETRIRGMEEADSNLHRLMWSIENTKAIVEAMPHLVDRVALAEEEIKRVDQRLYAGLRTELINLTERVSRLERQPARLDSKSIQEVSDQLVATPGVYDQLQGEYPRDDAPPDEPKEPSLWERIKNLFKDSK